MVDASDSTEVIDIVDMNAAHTNAPGPAEQIFTDAIYDACDTPVQHDANPATMGAIVETEKKIYRAIELLLTQIKGLQDNELKEMLDKFVSIYRHSFERCVFLPDPEGCEETDPLATLRHHLSLRLDQWNEWFADKGVDRTLGRRFKDPNSKNKARMEGDEAVGLEEMKQRIQDIEKERLYEAELQKYQADQERTQPENIKELKALEKEKKSEERRLARAERAKEKKRQKDIEFLKTITLEKAVGYVEPSVLEIYKAKCHLCEDRLTDAKYMIVHEKIKHPMMFFCHYCDRTFAGHGPMRVHCETVHIGLPVDPPGRRPPERANCTKGLNGNNNSSNTAVTLSYPKAEEKKNVVRMQRKPVAQKAADTPATVSSSPNQHDEDEKAPILTAFLATSAMPSKRGRGGRGRRGGHSEHWEEVEHDGEDKKDRSSERGGRGKRGGRGGRGRRGRGGGAFKEIRPSDTGMPILQPQDNSIALEAMAHTEPKTPPPKPPPKKRLIAVVAPMKKIPASPCESPRPGSSGLNRRSRGGRRSRSRVDNSFSSTSPVTNHFDNIFVEPTPSPRTDSGLTDDQLIEDRPMTTQQANAVAGRSIPKREAFGAATSPAKRDSHQPRNAVHLSDLPSTSAAGHSLPKSDFPVARSNRKGDCPMGRVAPQPHIFAGTSVPKREPHQFHRPSTAHPIAHLPSTSADSKLGIATRMPIQRDESDEDESVDVEMHVEEEVDVEGGEEVGEEEEVDVEEEEVDVEGEEEEEEEEEQEQEEEVDVEEEDMEDTEEVDVEGHQELEEKEVDLDEEEDLEKMEEEAPVEEPVERRRAYERWKVLRSASLPPYGIVDPVFHRFRPLNRRFSESDISTPAEAARLISGIGEVLKRFGLDGSSSSSSSSSESSTSDDDDSDSDDDDSASSSSDSSSTSSSSSASSSSDSDTDPDLIEQRLVNLLTSRQGVAENLRAGGRNLMSADDGESSGNVQQISIQSSNASEDGRSSSHQEVPLDGPIHFDRHPPVARVPNSEERSLGSVEPQREEEQRYSPQVRLTYQQQNGGITSVTARDQYPHSVSSNVAGVRMVGRVREGAYDSDDMSSIAGSNMDDTEASELHPESSASRSSSLLLRMRQNAMRAPAEETDEDDLEVRRISNMRGRMPDFSVGGTSSFMARAKAAAESLVQRENEFSENNYEEEESEPPDIKPDIEELNARMLSEDLSRTMSRRTEETNSESDETEQRSVDDSQTVASEATQYTEMGPPNSKACAFLAKMKAAAAARKRSAAELNSVDGSQFGDDESVDGEDDPRKRASDLLARMKAAVTARQQSAQDDGQSCTSDAESVLTSVSSRASELPESGANRLLSRMKQMAQRNAIRTTIKEESSSDSEGTIVEGQSWESVRIAQKRSAAKAKGEPNWQRTRRGGARKRATEAPQLSDESSSRPPRKKRTTQYRRR